MERTEINRKDRIANFAGLVAVVIFAWSGLVTASTPAPRSEEQARIALSREWKLLLHYRSDFKGHEQSEVTESSFFLSATGNVNPLSELEATLRAFARPFSDKIGPYEQHPQCVFPERFQFLKSRLSGQAGAEIPEAPCPEFERWKSGLNVRNVTLVFADAYMGNPASMFGHTLLRLGSDRAAMLDAAVSFDASPTEDNRATFVVKGLTGGYPGAFSQQPYYLKVESYSHIENRNLLEYELNLDQSQIDRLVRHLWEMASARFDYYFLNENCSYHLLSLLEIANPEWNLRDHFHLMTIPIDTVRALTEIPGAIRISRNRPSLFALMQMRLGHLSQSDRDSFETIRIDESKFTGKESVAVLDVLLDWQKYRPSKFQERLLLARANSGGSEFRPEANSVAVPPLGHRSSKLAGEVGNENGVARFGFGLRPALHDELDSNEGFASASSLTVLKLAGSYFPSLDKIALDEFTFGAVESRPAMTLLQAPPSWVIGARLERPRDTGCVDCVAGQVRFGIGATVEKFRNRANFSAMALGQTEISNAFISDMAQSFRFGPSIEFAVTFRFADTIRTRLAIEKFWYFGSFANRAVSFNRITPAVAMSVGTDFELRLEGEIRLSSNATENDLKLGCAHYF